MGFFGLNDIDTIILGFSFLATLLIAAAVYISYFVPDGKIEGLRKKLKPEYRGATVIYLGQQEGAIGYIAQFLDGDAVHDQAQANMRDIITKRIFPIGPINMKENIRVFRNLGLFEGRVVLGCNIDMKNRIYPWGPLQEDLYRRQLDAITEHRIETLAREKLDDLLEWKNNRTQSEAELPTEI